MKTLKRILSLLVIIFTIFFLSISTCIILSGFPREKSFISQLSQNWISQVTNKSFKEYYIKYNFIEREYSIYLEDSKDKINAIIVIDVRQGFGLTSIKKLVFIDKKTGNEIFQDLYSDIKRRVQKDG